MVLTLRIFFIRKSVYKLKYPQPIGIAAYKGGYSVACAVYKHKVLGAVCGRVKLKHAVRRHKPVPVTVAEHNGYAVLAHIVYNGYIIYANARPLFAQRLKAAHNKQGRQMQHSPYPVAKYIVH